MQPVEVQAPPVNPLRIGLEAGGRTPPDQGSARWQLGIYYDPNFDDLGGHYPSEACNDPPEPLVPGDLEKVIPAGQAINQWWPYTLWLGEACSVMGGLRRDDFEPKLRRQLGAQTTRLLELAFSSGILQISATESYTFAELGYPNTPLEDPAATTPIGTVPVGLVPGIAAMVEALSEEIGSARGMIHVPHQLLPYLDFYSQVVRNPSDGSFITLKSHDHIVIAGTGYAGNSPDGEPGVGDNVFWIYGTSMVDVRLAEIEVMPPGTFEAEAIDLRQNTIEYRAERLALASWDLSAHIAIPIQVLDPGPEVTAIS